MRDTLSTSIGNLVTNTVSMSMLQKELQILNQTHHMTRLPHLAPYDGQLVLTAPEQKPGMNEYTYTMYKTFTIKTDNELHSKKIVGIENSRNISNNW